VSDQWRSDHPDPSHCPKRQQSSVYKGNSAF
jgi:hypothetical protein